MSPGIHLCDLVPPIQVANKYTNQLEDWGIYKELKQSVGVKTRGRYIQCIYVYVSSQLRLCSSKAPWKTEEKSELKKR